MNVVQSKNIQRVVMEIKLLSRTCFPTQFIGAVSRLFERLKRQWLDNLPENRQKAKVEERKRHKSSRMKRVHRQEHFATLSSIPVHDLCLYIVP